VDTGFDKNKTETGVTVLSVLFQVLSDVDGLLNQVVKVFWEFWGETLGLQDSEDLVTGERFDVGNTLSITKSDTDFRWRETLSCQFVDLVLDIIYSVEVLEPSWGSSNVWGG